MHDLHTQAPGLKAVSAKVLNVIQLQNEHVEIRDPATLMIYVQTCPNEIYAGCPHFCAQQLNIFAHIVATTTALMAQCTQLFSQPHCH